MSKSRLMFAALIFVAAGSVQADTIYDNGPSSYESGSISDDTYFEYPSRQADDFSLEAGANVITDVHWWGSYHSYSDPYLVPPGDNFTIRFYESLSGMPALTAFAEYIVGANITRIDTNAGTVLPFYEYSADISPLVLAADTTYFLSIVNNVGYSGYWTWAWNGEDATNRFVGALDRHGVAMEWYGDSTFDLAFNLTNDNLPIVPIPEPFTMSLLGMGLAGLAARRVRRAA